MPRAVPEWIGKSDDVAPPPRVKLRILGRQENKCALTGTPIPPGVTPHFDHILALRDGGENRESNLQAVMPDAHRKKTAREAKERAKVDRMRKASHGLKAPPAKPIQSAGFDRKARTHSERPTLPRRNLYEAAQ